MNEPSLDEMIVILKAAGYYLEVGDYYNPGGEVYHDVVFYPDGKSDRYGHFPNIDMRLETQWRRAWKHYRATQQPPK